MSAGNATGLVVVGGVGLLAWKSGALASLAAAISGHAGSLTSGGAATAPSGGSALLGDVAAVPDLLAASDGPTALVPYVLGGSVAVPAAYVQLSKTAQANLSSSGYTPAGGYQSQNYVAGSHPASSSSPAGGGVWAGLNDGQTAQLFQSTYGNGWQQVWQQQHDAAS